MTTLADRPLAQAPLDALIELLHGKRLVVLAGAGCSTESGIPDYRGPDGSHRSRKPMQYQEFMRSEAGRARYWARSTVGWTRMAGAGPNDAHRALARLEAGGAARGIITQNVDGLHHAAGSRRVVELHGSLAAVRCMGCDRVDRREDYQERLLAMNPDWLDGLDGGVCAPGMEAAPDGDAELPGWAMERFRVPGCETCEGVMKPDVVFFGENVPPARVEAAWRLYDEADALLVVGSSLTVYSGRRFIYRAAKDGAPIAIVNIGPTRADDAAAVRVEGRLGAVLPMLADALLSPVAEPRPLTPRPPSPPAGIP